MRMNVPATAAWLAGLAALALSSSATRADYLRPFGADAPWNVPVAGLPQAPRSDTYVEKLWNEGSNQPGNVNLSFDSYTYPVYDARQAIGTYSVSTINRGANLDGQSMPWNPLWKPSAGSDGQVIVLDPPTGREWDLWRVRFNGRTVRASNGSLVPGSYWTRTTGWEPSRGCGIPYLAMLVRPAEVAQGVIPHALSMPILNVDRASFVAPAIKTDGPAWGVPGGIPEGTRFALRATDADIEAWASALPRALPEAARRSARVIATALRDYGWFVTDHAGSAHLQFEDRLTAGPAWDALGLADREVRGKRYPRDLLDGLLTPGRIYALAPSVTPHRRSRQASQAGGVSH